jgi:hypothetical protein
MLIRSAVVAGVSLPPEVLRSLDGLSSPASLFDGLDKLGLKLVATKAPLDVLVIDKMLKSPMENCETQRFPADPTHEGGSRSGSRVFLPARITRFNFNSRGPSWNSVIPVGTPLSISRLHKCFFVWLDSYAMLVFSDSCLSIFSHGSHRRGDTRLKRFR